ncbi:MAG TPA: Smr/MutS family protein [Pyrinomonadaceae bacterium]|nr:Smr/MutS family protein [Pyrinomonadaceae bacterium]
MRFIDWISGLFGARRPARGKAWAEPFDPEEEEDDQDGDPFDPFPEPVRIEIGDVFDLHAIAPRDVKRVVEEYLSEARRAGFRSVRIIHGKGKGVQREMVCSILARTPFVEAWTDAPPEAGGWGATIAHLSRPDKANL